VLLVASYLVCLTSHVLEAFLLLVALAFWAMGLISVMEGSCSSDACMMQEVQSGGNAGDA